METSNGSVKNGSCGWERNRDDLRVEKAASARLSRPVYIKNARNRQEPSKVDLSIIGRKCKTIASRTCRMQSIYRGVLSLFPVLTWLPVYKWRTDLLPDFLAGLTVGVMSIPQGMAYAKLAGMPPVYGLYTNIIPTFVYFVFGTTKHAAIGPATVLSLIMSSIRYKHIPCENCWMQTSNATINWTMDNGTAAAHGHDVGLTPIDLGTAVAFLAGAFMILMGLFRLSFISDFLPDQLVGGFTVAAAVQVFAGQLPSIFGVTLPNRNEVGKVIMNFVDLFTRIGRTNVATLIVFFICFAFLVFSKHVINPRFQPKCRLPFPGEFLVMVVATLASHFGQLHQKYQVPIVDHIAAGLPQPSVPKTSIMGMLAADSFVLAVVTYSYSISLAKLYAKRNGYKIQSTQEFYAYGFMNFIGSFFQCFNSGQSVARSLVYEMAGAKSQLCGLFGTFVVIITVLFIAPFLESLPNAALAAIIVTAVMEMLRNLRDLPPLFRKSKYDFAIYLVTLVSVIVLDVTYGLAISVAFALITVLLQTQRSRVETANLDARVLYTSIGRSDEENEDIPMDFWRKLLVLRLASPVFYVNSEKVKHRLLDQILSGGRAQCKENDGVIVPMEKLPSAKTAAANHEERPTVVILDMSAVAFVDLMGVNALKELHRKLTENEIDLYLCGCTTSAEKIMRSAGLLDNEAAPSVFPSTLDAISFARYRLSEKWSSDQKSSRTTVISQF